MKINLAKSAGFCFGVKRAFDIALDSAGAYPDVCMLGDIVHNEDVVRQIQKAGIKKIQRLTRVDDRALLIRAHGACQETFQQARQLGYKIIDATCPMVKHIHKIAQRAEKNGFAVIVIGDKKHDEVQGIVGQLENRAIIIDTVARLPLKNLKGIKKAAVVVQSTQNLEDVLKMVGGLKRYIKELKFFNTICKPTRTKQQEIRTLPEANDVMIIIGSKTSANTKRLYEISRSLNKRSYWVSSSQEIKRGWFKGANSVGVTAGASTPDATTREVIAYIGKIA